MDLNSQKRKFLLLCPPDWLHSHDVQEVYTSKPIPPPSTPMYTYFLYLQTPYFIHLLSCHLVLYSLSRPLWTSLLHNHLSFWGTNIIIIKLNKKAHLGYKFVTNSHQKVKRKQSGDLHFNPFTTRSLLGPTPIVPGTVIRRPLRYQHKIKIFTQCVLSRF